MSGDRRGHSLIEMSAAMSIGTVLMLLAVQLVHRAMLHDRAQRDHAAVQRVAQRVTRQFRIDVEAATVVTLSSADGADAAGGVTVVTLARHAADPLEWRFAGGAAVRSEPRPEGLPHRETYDLPAECAYRCAWATEDGRAALDILRRTPAADATWRLETRVMAQPARLAPWNLVETSP
jgi:prepilin-type N-terminal cleavage/methylation domain-containing protein